MRIMRKYPAATIGNGKVVDKLSQERSTTPGPNSYQPNLIKFKKRTRTIIFDQAKRDTSLAKSRQNATPGPGAYLIPCKFFDRPKFMLKHENQFRYV